MHYNRMLYWGEPGPAEPWFTPGRRPPGSNRHRWGAYRLSDAQFNSILAQQGGVCANPGCRTSDPGKGWCVDHDHTCCSGKGPTCGRCFRGILCHNCNLGLGQFGEDLERVRGAVVYLERYVRTKEQELKCQP